MKLSATILLVLTIHIAHGQDLMNEVKTVAGSAATTVAGAAKTEAIKDVSNGTMPSLNDLTSSKGPIMDKLGSALSLTDKQTPAVANVVTTFLQKKSVIMPLLTTDKKSYNSKFAVIKSGLLSGMKKSVTSGQYAKFLKLKPKTANTISVLTGLFY